MKTYKLIRVDWEDCHSHGGWLKRSKIKDMGAIPCISTGIKLPSKRKCVALATTMALDDTMVNEVTIIPRKMIKNIQVLGEFRA